MGGMYKLIPNDLNLPNELLRLQMKELAVDVRLKYAQKGLSDIFDILSEEALLVRMPLQTNQVSGFSTFFEKHFVVYLNSNFTLGHERFSGAHELYHIKYNCEILKKEKLLLNDAHSIEDDKADIFASELLMPEDYVKEIFYKVVNMEPTTVLPRHIVRMNNNLKVSYKAMLKRLIQLGLCSADNYKKLAEIGSIENAETLQLITKSEGYNLNLITSSKIVNIPQQYIEYIKSNYENDLISYNNMKYSVELLGLTTEQFGYEYPKEEDY